MKQYKLMQVLAGNPYCSVGLVVLKMRKKFREMYGMGLY